MEDAEMSKVDLLLTIKEVFKDVAIVLPHQHRDSAVIWLVDHEMLMDNLTRAIDKEIHASNQQAESQSASSNGRPHT